MLPTQSRISSDKTPSLSTSSTVSGEEAVLQERACSVCLFSPSLSGYRTAVYGLGIFADKFVTPHFCSSRPQRAVSSPSDHSRSTYPSSCFTFCTVSLSPVFLPALSLVGSTRVSNVTGSQSHLRGTHLILMAGRPAAELSLMTMLSGTDFVPVLRCVKSLVRKVPTPNVGWNP